MLIEVNSNGYGGHSWTLVAYGKQFYLGQDVKFCRRVLGMEPRQIVREIGTNDLRSDSARAKLARLIVKNLHITRSNIKTLSAWDICAE